MNKDPAVWGGDNHSNIDRTEDIMSVAVSVLLIVFVVIRFVFDF